MNAEEKFPRPAKPGPYSRISRLVLFPGIAILVALADRSPLELETVSAEINISQKFVYYWQGVVYRFFPGPYVYRVFIPYFYWLLNAVSHVNLITIDFYVKVILLIACQYSLLNYLSCFFEPIPSLLGVFIFDSLLGYFLSFIKGPSIIETMDILNFMVMTLALTAIYKKKYSYAAVIFVIGLLNRETPLILLPVLFVHEWLVDGSAKNSVYIMVIATAAFLGVRLLLPSSAGSTWFNLGELKANLPFIWGVASREAVIGNLRLAALVSPFVLMGFYKFSKHPQFLRLAACLIPAIIIIHYLVARIIEARLWMPLFPLFIPLTVNNLIRFYDTPSQTSTET